jgi:hypothetical protein
MVPSCNYLRHLSGLVDLSTPFLLLAEPALPPAPIGHLSRTRKRVAWYRDSQAQGPAVPRVFPSA